MKLKKRLKKALSFRLYVLTGERLNKKLLKAYDDGRQKNHKLLHEALARNAELEFKYNKLRQQLAQKASKK